jgi:hypothetical protein
LSRKLLGSFNIFRTTFRALMKTLKLALKMRNLGLGMRSKPAGEGVPDLSSAGESMTPKVVDITFSVRVALSQERTN